MENRKSFFSKTSWRFETTNEDDDTAPQSQNQDPAPSTSHEPTRPEWAEAEPGASSDEEIVPVSMEGTDQQRLDQGDQNMNPFCVQMKTIRDLKESPHLGSIAGKVVRKSGLRPCKDKNKKKMFFHLGLADKTDCIKVTVYGKQRYEEIKEGSYYLFRKVSMEGQVVKVESISKISQTSSIRVPAYLQLEARMIIDPQKPVCSIKEAKASRDETEMSVKGTITKMNPGPQRTTVQRVFHLQDDTGSIEVCLSGDVATECRASVGEFVVVTNVRSGHSNDTVSLSSTGTTRVEKVQAATVQTGTVEIKGIFEASKTSAKVEAVFGHQMRTLFVASKLLATAFNIKLEDNFEERLLDRMPLFGQAEIQRNKITAIKKM